MKALSIAIVAGVLLTGAVSAGAQYLLAGKTFDVMGEVALYCREAGTTHTVNGKATFGTLELDGAYWRALEADCGSTVLTYSPDTLYFELPLGTAGSLAVAFRKISGIRFLGFDVLAVDDYLIDYFYVWRDGAQMHFVCIPTVPFVPWLQELRRPAGYLMGTSAPSEN